VNKVHTIQLKAEDYSIPLSTKKARVKIILRSCPYQQAAVEETPLTINPASLSIEDLWPIMFLEVRKTTKKYLIINLSFGKHWMTAGQKDKEKT
jgi:hypothetical protein